MSGQFQHEEAVRDCVRFYDRQDAATAQARLEFCALDHTPSIARDVMNDVEYMIGSGWDDKDWAVY